jgi:2-polyprenyl-3-methyl-5-hydroxy-6-metoxy-1,4-benzoquinol methylase
MTDVRPPFEKTEYEWAGAGHAHNHGVLIPPLRRILGEGLGRRLIDLGCGNGSLTAVLAARGFATTGLDLAVSGIRNAQAAYPDTRFLEHDITEPLPSALHGEFDVALAAEVIEHLYLPRRLFQRATEALGPGGVLVVTTPYHGWLKNVALAVTGKLDHHYRPGWDHGHIKFFSRATLAAMADECRFDVLEFHRVGRIPPLAMSMIVVAEKRAE